MALTATGSKAQLGRSVRLTAGGGILCRHAHSLFIYLVRDAYGRKECRRMVVPQSNCRPIEVES